MIITVERRLIHNEIYTPRAGLPLSQFFSGVSRFFSISRPVFSAGWDLLGQKTGIFGQKSPEIPFFPKTGISAENRDSQKPRDNGSTGLRRSGVLAILLDI